MRKINEEDEAEEDEDGSADECNIIAPEHEELIWNEKRDNNKDEPDQDFGSPPSAASSACF